MSGADDVVELRLGIADETTVVIATSYEIHLGIFDTPQTFSLRLATGETAAELLRRYPPGTDFRISVNGAPQFSGYTIENASDMGPNTGTEITVSGEDVLGPICDDEVDREESFEAATHVELVKKALEAVELIKPFEVDPPKIISSNAANRQKLTGQPIRAVEDSSESELLQTAGSKGDAFVILRSKLAEKRINLLRRHLDSAGLFCWGGAEGDVIVGQPNHKQPPLYRLERRIGRIATSNIVAHSYKNTFKPRYSVVALHGKTTGRKYSRVSISGGYSDDELVSRGYHKVRVLRDGDVTSIRHAEHLAKKILAEGRRKGFTLEYTLVGHSAPSLIDGGRTRAVWAPDTVVEVEDEMLGISGKYWIESVKHRRGPETTSTIKLLSPDVLIFGDDAFPTPR